MKALLAFPDADNCSFCNTVSGFWRFVRFASVMLIQLSELESIPPRSMAFLIKLAARKEYFPYGLFCRCFVHITYC